MIEYDGNTDLDVDTRLAVARSMFNQLYPLLEVDDTQHRGETENLPRVRRHDGETRVGSLDAQREDAQETEGVVQQLPRLFTGRTHREEAGTDSSFDITATIRAQRLKYLGKFGRIRKGGFHRSHLTILYLATPRAL